MTTVPLPDDMSWGFVACRVIDIVADTPDDPDALPDPRPVSGTVTFTPPRSQTKTSSPDKAIVLLRQVVCQLDPATGVMQDAEGRPTVALATGVWNVTFAISSGTIPALTIEVTAAHTQGAPLQLSEAVPYTPPPGSTVKVLPVPDGWAVGQTLIWDGTGVTWADLVQGADGPPNVLTIGTVSEGPAAATITGTSPAQTLSLVIPKGADGTPGEPAPTTATAALTTGASAGTVSLEKGGTRIVATVSGLTKASTVEHVATLPAGYTPAFAQGHGWLVDSAGEWWPAHVSPTQLLILGPPPAGTVLSGSLTWRSA